MRRRRSERRSGRSPRPTTRRPPSGAPKCSARRRHSAGPAAGTRCSSPPIGSAAPRSMRAFESRLRRHLERFRMAGYDLEVDGPRYVALDVALHICVRPDYFRSEVAARRARRARHRRAARRPARACSIPDNFSFGEPVYLSRIVAAAQAVEGVEAVWAQKFQRMARSRSGVARERRDPDRPARDRAAGQQPELPRARTADARGRRRQMSEAAARRRAPRPAAAATASMPARRGRSTTASA